THTFWTRIPGFLRSAGPRRLDALAGRSPVGRAQLALEQLADRAARQRIADLDRRQALVLAEPLVGPRLERRGLDRAAGLEHDQTDRRLAPALGGHADHRHVG